MTDPEFSIITRTSGRPTFFDLCQESIVTQTYNGKNIHKYVTFDDASDVNSYINKHQNLLIIETEREKRKNPSHFPYHNYINEVLSYIDERVKAGDVQSWIIILDDDTTLAKKDSLAILSKQIVAHHNDPTKIFIWKCLQANGVVFPNETNFKKTIKKGDLHTSCFAFHSSQIENVHFEPKKDAEVDVINTLLKKSTCVWIDDTLTKTAVSGNGQRLDLVAEPKKKLTMKTQLPPPTEAPAPTHKKLTLLHKEITPPVEPSLKYVRQDIGDVDADVDENAEEDIGAEEDVGDDADADEDVDVGGDVEDEVDVGIEVEDDDADEPAVPEKEDDGEETITIRQNPKRTQDVAVQKKTPPASAPVSASVSASVSAPVSVPAPTVPIKTIDKQTQVMFDRFLNLLESGRKIYVLDENNMKTLAKCLNDSLTCLESEDKLIKLLDGKLIESKMKEIKSRTPVPATQVASSTKTPNATSTATATVNTTSKNEPRDPTQVDQIYLLTDDPSSKNTNLERNKKILTTAQLSFEVVQIKQKTQYAYQMQIKELITRAKEDNCRSIIVINGNDLLNAKFKGIYERQMTKIGDDCLLWFFGNVREISPKEIVNTQFDVDDYLFLYEDIVSAKFTTEEKAKVHWKSYGCKEARFASIDVYNSVQSIANNYGFMIHCEAFDPALLILDKLTPRDNKNFMIELQKTLNASKRIWCSRPDLIIPAFGGGSNAMKNKTTALKNGWYYNFYHN
jgi:hypothetical protein